MDVIMKADDDSGDLVGVDRAWPVLFKVMGVLGFVLPKRHPRGHYEPSWVRLVPVVLITCSMCWFLLTYPVKFTEVAYDGTLALLTYIICNGSVIYTFAVGIYKRHELCSLFAGLEGTLKPCRTYVTVISTFLFALYCVAWLFMNYWIVNWETVSLLYCLSMTFNSPLVLALMDLYVFYLIGALCQAYAKATKRVIDQGALSLPNDPLFLPNKSHLETHESLSNLSHLGYFALLQVRY